MKGAMEHAGSTCCCTQEHRWAWRQAGVPTPPLLSTKQLQAIQEGNNNYGISF